MAKIERIQPDLVNQFRRLVELPTQGTYAYGAAWNNGVGGHDFDAENCMAAQGAVVASVQTGCERHFSPNEIRLHQDDFAGGIGHDDVQVALARLGLPKAIVEPVRWEESIDWVREGRFVWWAIRYDVMPDGFQAQLPGAFDHAIGACHLYPDGSIDVYDSLRKSIVRMPQYAIRKAAEAMALRERGNADRLFVGASNVIPATGLVLRYGGVKTKPYPDRTRADAKDKGGTVNVHSAPRTGTSSVIGTLAHGQVFTASQVTTTGDSFEGSRTWYGNKAGSRWINARRLSHEGGLT